MQFEVKDIDHRGYYLRLCRGGAKTWLCRYKLRGKLRRVNLGRYPLIDCVQAFNRYSEVWKQVIGGIDVYQQRNGVVTVDTRIIWLISIKIVGSQASSIVIREKAFWARLMKAKTTCRQRSLKCPLSTLFKK